MQFDDETNAEEAQENAMKQTLHHCQPNSPLQDQNPMEDTEAGGTIGTAVLLASEVVGSWACSTAPSVHGENYFPTSEDKMMKRVPQLYMSPVVCHGAISGDDQDTGEREGTSDSDTEDCSDNDDDNKIDSQGASDAETAGSDQANEDPRCDDEIDEDDEATQEDSVG
ncbi:unnamed protein product [Fraxinus pennsylvanica]|uniref:Uncharacterized protein n=1 Tax=Fraxinus pennsylvanica TaxID=56036 RepID=A0AAD1Z8M6_9LAMI|nr:unnamed protein product [Fraxinus pennsylvanica]